MTISSSNLNAYVDFSLLGEKGVNTFSPPSIWNFISPFFKSTSSKSVLLNVPFLDKVFSIVNYEKDSARIQKIFNWFYDHYQLALEYLSGFYNPNWRGGYVHEYEETKDVLVNEEIFPEQPFNELYHNIFANPHVIIEQSIKRMEEGEENLDLFFESFESSLQSLEKEWFTEPLSRLKKRVLEEILISHLDNYQKNNSFSDQDEIALLQFATRYALLNVLEHFKDLMWNREDNLLERYPDETIKALLLASKQGSLFILQWFNKINPEILRVRNKTGDTIVHYAAIGGHLDILEWLNQEYPELFTKRLKGWTIVFLSAQLGHLHILQWINQLYPEMFIEKILQGKTIAHLTALGGHLNVLKWLLDSEIYATMLIQLDANGESIAHFAAFGGHLDVLKWLFHSEVYSTILNQKSLEGKTIAHLAALGGRLHVLEWLNQVCPDLLMQQTLMGWSIAHFAALGGDLDILKWLFHSEVYSTILNQETSEGKTIAHLAAVGGHLHVLQWIYQIHPEMLMQQIEGGWSIAHLAAKGGYLDILEWLNQVSPGALTQLNANGESIAHYAAFGGHLDILKWLFDSEIYSDMLIQLNSDGESIAHFAGLREHFHILQWLKHTFPEMFKTEETVIIQKVLPEEKSKKRCTIS